ncbi:phosphoribosylpyrophosphate synthetase [Legionella qingyii]|uniref:ribose-phosphate diphosphokinase n=1 Tax=Legionella qingyii TaxID=2184757 RepID=A0A317U413_9GAMM|nr:ribose-phosphate diphosphokinase [Legionella qingyii]PWY55282.1 phosphoribosylpyrophosphate synthetase [Legionella qingyii]RUR22796.1 ribose-phosphate diphosphokinase [Legionella qingyii]RUR23865.1 ribose-phosphate diphosphokinase [Legionella qingyii]
MKKSPIIFALFGHDELTSTIHHKCHYELGKISFHQFPDKETLVKIESDVAKRVVIFVANLVHPNPKTLPLLFAAQTAKSLGASKIVLITPYLTYMRQDKVFQPGQGITSLYFAELISSYFDYLITVDPHLHRWPDLNAIYKIPTKVLHATYKISAWISQHVSNPILIGPDSESAQWVESIAQKSSVPFTILEKRRSSDTQVEISIPGIKQYQNATPILIDDIISTGMTMMETLAHLSALNMKPAVCIGVHAVFAENAYQKLLLSRATKIITCNTIPHTSNNIDVSQDIIYFLLNWNTINE